MKNQSKKTKLDLNFLPQREQQNISKEVLRLLIRNVVIWLMFIIIVSVIAMLWGRIVLEENLAGVQEQKIMVSESNLGFTDQVRDLNNFLKDLDEVQEGYTQWSSVLQEVSALMPEGSFLTELSLDERTGVFSMKGISQTRQDLLDLEGALKASEHFTDIDSPLANLLEPIDIKFVLSGVLDLDPK